MTRLGTFGVAATLALIVGIVASPGIVTAKTATPPPSYSYQNIDHLIKKNCIACHNPDRHPEKVDLSSYEAIMKSGDKGPIVVPGKPLKSSFFLYINGAKSPRMPYKKPPLSKADINAFKLWIQKGAKNS